MFRQLFPPVHLPLALCVGGSNDGRVLRAMSQGLRLDSTRHIFRHTPKPQTTPHRDVFPAAEAYRLAAVRVGGAEALVYVPESRMEEFGALSKAARIDLFKRAVVATTEVEA